jgi:hypothetical protein
MDNGFQTQTRGKGKGKAKKLKIESRQICIEILKYMDLAANTNLTEKQV